MDEAARLRARAILSSWFIVLVGLAIVFGGVGMWATYTAHVDPGTTTEQRTTTAWSATGEFVHSATVTRQNPLYPVGTELTNRSTYFRKTTPELDGAFTVSQRGLTSDVSVDLTATLLLQSADEETTYWTDQRQLNETTAAGVGTRPVTIGFDLNVTRVAERIAEIEAGIGSAPGETSAAVVVTGEISGTTDGAQSRLTFSRRLSLDLGGDTYAVSTPGDPEERVQREVTVETPREYGPLRAIGGPLAFVVGALATGGLAYAAREDQLSLDGAERERLAYLHDRAEFDEWIVSVRSPPVDDDQMVAEAASLADLVNLAIDSDAAVLENSTDETFHVIVDGVRYRYDPPPTPDSGGGSLPFAGSTEAAGDTTSDSGGDTTDDSGGPQSNVAPESVGDDRIDAGDDGTERPTEQGGGG